MLSYYVSISCLIVLAHSFENNPVVDTSLGRISGHYKKSHDGRTFSAFEGIPFAKPPIGDLRFRAPQKLEPWTGTWNATTMYRCAQLNWFSRGIKLETVGNEDCLYLNVYVPAEKTNENLDVAVHIHGGAFMLGSAEFGGPELLMDRDVVYVNINYRLGILGFLYTEDSTVSGNNGLKDQLSALKWIQNNIQYFGGNPKSVTLLGVSAGAASVHLHYFSPLATGLFHRGVSHSGTALAPWAIQEAPLLMAQKLAKLVGCPIACNKELVKCLKQRPPHEIVKYSYSLFPFMSLPITPFSPVVEKEEKGAYLTDYPYNLLLRGEIHDVPWICTATTEEGILALTLGMQVSEIAQQWNTVVPLLLNYYITVDDKYQNKVSEKVKQFYYGDETVSTENIQTFIKMVGDRLFYLNMEQATRMQAKVTKSAVYAYIFGYRGEFKYGEMFGLTESYGVTHCEDTNYYYNLTMGDIILRKGKFTGNDGRIKDLMLNIITSFAKNGKPVATNLKWESMNGDSENYRYLSIKNDAVQMDATRELAPTQFWHSLPIKENENMHHVTKEEL